MLPWLRWLLVLLALGRVASQDDRDDDSNRGLPLIFAHQGLSTKTQRTDVVRGTFAVELSLPNDGSVEFFELAVQTALPDICATRWPVHVDSIQNQQSLATSRTQLRFFYYIIPLEGTKKCMAELYPAEHRMILAQVLSWRVRQVPDLVEVGNEFESWFVTMEEPQEVSVPVRYSGEAPPVPILPATEPHLYLPLHISYQQKMRYVGQAGDAVANFMGARMYERLGRGGCRRADGTASGANGPPGKDACYHRCFDAGCSAYSISDKTGACYIYWDGPYVTTEESNYRGYDDWTCFAIHKVTTTTTTQAFDFLSTGGCRRDDGTANGENGPEGTDTVCLQFCTYKRCDAFAHSEEGAGACYIYHRGPYVKTEETNYRGRSDWQCYARQQGPQPSGHCGLAKRPCTCMARPGCWWNGTGDSCASGVPPRPRLPGEDGEQGEEETVTSTTSKPIEGEEEEEQEGQVLNAHLGVAGENVSNETMNDPYSPICEFCPSWPTCEEILLPEDSEPRNGELCASTLDPCVCMVTSVGCFWNDTTLQCEFASRALGGEREDGSEGVVLDTPKTSCSACSRQGVVCQSPLLVKIDPPIGSGAIFLFEELVLTFDRLIRVSQGAVAIQCESKAGFLPVSLRSLEASGRELHVHLAGEHNEKMAKCLLYIGEGLVEDPAGIRYLGMSLGSYAFYLRDTVGPQLLKMKPPSGSLVKKETNIVLTFNEDMSKTNDFVAYVVILGEGTQLLQGSNSTGMVVKQFKADTPGCTISGQRVSFSMHTLSNEYSREYALVIPRGLTDAAGNKFAGLLGETYTYRTIDDPYPEEPVLTVSIGVWLLPLAVCLLVGGGVLLVLWVLNPWKYRDLAPDFTRKRGGTQVWLRKGQVAPLELPRTQIEVGKFRHSQAWNLDIGSMPQEVLPPDLFELPKEKPPTMKRLDEDIDLSQVPHDPSQLQHPLPPARFVEENRLQQEGACKVPQRQATFAGAPRPPSSPQAPRVPRSQSMP